MADWAPPEAHNRESSSNSLKISARCCWAVSCLETLVMSKPVATHHALNLLEEDTAVKDTRLSEPWCSPKLLQHVLHNLAAELVVCELRGGQQAEGSHDRGGRPESQDCFKLLQEVLDVNPVVGVRCAERVQDV